MSWDEHLDDSSRKVLRPKFGELQLIKGHRATTGPIACEHKYMVIIEARRAAYCRQCGTELDPYQALARLAKNWDCATHHQAKLDAARCEIDELRREEKRIKARLKRAGGKLTTDRVDHFLTGLIDELRRVDTSAGFRILHGWFQHGVLTDGERERLRVATDAAHERIADAELRRKSTGPRLVRDGKP